MKKLFVYRTEPDELTKQLAGGLAQGHEVTEFNLFEPDPDYGRLVDLIFAHEKVVSWW
ncbi:MAG: hypothetical protein KKC37_11075 [Proteobacteria bacterium]|nr:hypothetical protein [Pseudomonadota bacterium]